MRNFIIVLAISVLPAAAHAQILKCIGAGGRIEFATACPPGMKAENTGIRNTPGAAPAASRKSLSDRDADFRKRQMEQQDATKKADENAQRETDRKKNCAIAQNYLRELQSGNRIGKTDPATGERVFLTDEDRVAEAARAQRGVDSSCK